MHKILPAFVLSHSCRFDLYFKKLWPSLSQSYSLWSADGPSDQNVTFWLPSVWPPRNQARQKSTQKSYWGDWHQHLLLKIAHGSKKEMLMKPYSCAGKKKVAMTASSSFPTLQISLMKLAAAASSCFFSAARRCSWKPEPVLALAQGLRSCGAGADLKALKPIHL